MNPVTSVSVGITFLAYESFMSVLVHLFSQACTSKASSVLKILYFLC